MEMSIFKRSNFSDYLLNLDRLCELICDARKCIDACGTPHSNPFALTSMNIVCSPEARNVAFQLTSGCLAAFGAQINDQCIQHCGDYEAMNDQIRVATSTIKPGDRDAISVLSKQTNDACSVYKCSARCEADLLNQQCGRPAGDLLKKLVTGVLDAHRADLESHQLVQIMTQSSPPECHYLIRSSELFGLESKENPIQTLKLKVLEKQLKVLNKQERNLDREFEQLNLSQLLQKPRFFY